MEFAEELAPLGYRVLDPSRDPAPVLSGWSLRRGRFGPIPKTEQRRPVRAGRFAWRASARQARSPRESPNPLVWGRSMLPQ